VGFQFLAVEALRAIGHNVLWARTDMPGKSDDAILRQAQREDRLVVTFDKDFGELAYRWGLIGPPGFEPGTYRL
jgi:predicted nuclease of predicted toxin-antitoxin system